MKSVSFTISDEENGADQAKNDSLKSSPQNSSDPDNDDDDGSGVEEDNENYLMDSGPGLYNPADFEHLVVSPEIKELFQCIQRYVPHKIELETRLQPFIPDFIASIGDTDAFLKVPRPDGKPDNLGLTVLDEPSANQSDPTVLDLQLRAISKQKSNKEMVVKSIEKPYENAKEIDKWIKSINDLHLSKPPPTVHYVKPMPDMSTLMSEWPEEFEQTLKTVAIPTAALDCSLKEYVDIICALMDIPVYNNRIESLHLLFSLYQEFKNSQHFQKREEKKEPEGENKAPS